MSFSLLLSGCLDSKVLLPGDDAGAVDAGRDAGVDAGRDAGVDAGPPPPFCGDGAVDPGESCDDGPTNGEVVGGCDRLCAATLAHLFLRPRGRILLRRVRFHRFVPG